MRPPFIRVLPDEVEKHGAAAAVLLAHIRFRCESDGPGRVTAEGVRWWRVSRVDMADETGLSVQGVKTALKGLENVVAARHFPPLSNQSRAYRVATHQNGVDLPEVDFNQWNDLPEVEINRPEVEINHCRSGNQPLQKLESTSVLLTGEAREGGEARVRAGRRQATSERLTENPPPRTCKKHPHWDHDEPCPPCGADRRRYDTWVAASWALLSEHDRLADFLQSSDPKRSNAIRAGRKRRLTILQGLGETRK